MFTTKVVFPKSLKSTNSGSEGFPKKLRLSFGFPNQPQEGYQQDEPRSDPIDPIATGSPLTSNICCAYDSMAPGRENSTALRIGFGPGEIRAPTDWPGRHQENWRFKVSCSARRPPAQPCTSWPSWRKASAVKGGQMESRVLSCSVTLEKKGTFFLGRGSHKKKGGKREPLNN